MKQVVITQCPQYILDEQAELPIEIPAWVFEERIGLLAQRVKEKGLDFAVLYGDREHFANIEYFSRYDCRFEEALLIVSSEGKRWIVVGNEGEAYTNFIPYEIKVLRYRNFSLQGQPRENCPNLAELLASVGICSGSRIGLAGYKYFEPAIIEDGFDVPEYIVSVLRKLVGYENVNEFTRELTGLPHGLRMTVRHPVEVAYIEYKATKVANCIRRMFKALKPGISELELSKAAKIDFSPTQTHSMVNFGPNSLSMGIRSPSPKVYLQRGNVMSFAHSERGSLVCRAALAAEFIHDVRPEMRHMVDDFYGVYWKAVAVWYETIGVGCVGGELYGKVYDLIGEDRFGFALNPGHYIGGDEWVNTPFISNSKTTVHSGSHIQCDIIAGCSDPVATAICEDTIVIADAGLRTRIKEEYPELWQRILTRQTFMREKLGIAIGDDVLPMSNINGVMFPFMFNTDLMFAGQ